MRSRPRFLHNQIITPRKQPPLTMEIEAVRASRLGIAVMMLVGFGFAGLAAYLIFHG